MTEYEEMKLQEWAATPAKRKSQSEQAARWAWNALRNMTVGFFGVNAVSGIVLGLVAPELIADYPTYAGTCGMLALLASQVRRDAPRWWVKFYKRFC
ncbi:MAG: hypothetical protein LUH03_09715 [Oscillospiraceae bacterium]|nr:hypothetical protein [Oscillospiraceae bacterium]